MKKRISSLDGLKAIMMLLIFCWHTPYNPDSPIGTPAADLGARSCEVLFVIAGFLVGYRHYGSLMPATLRRSWDYVSGKIAKVWPVHFITFLIIAAYLARTDPHDFFSLSTVWDAVVNLCLLQAWSSDPFSFNSVAWFVSALMFCWFMSPLLMSVLKRSRCVVMTAFSVCAVLRIALELGSQAGISVFSFDFHVSPVIRCMEFFMGMLMVPAYLELRHAMDSSTLGSHSIDNHSTDSRVMINHTSGSRTMGSHAMSSHASGRTSKPGKIMAGLTIAELLVAACYTFLIFRMEGRWIRGYFVLAACVLVFTYALNGGAFSRLLSLKVFALFAVIQMEFYLLHQVIIRVVGPKLTAVSHSVFIQSVILFFITLGMAVLYDRFMKKKCTKAVERFLEHMESAVLLITGRK